VPNPKVCSPGPQSERCRTPKCAVPDPKVLGLVTGQLWARSWHPADGPRPSGPRCRGCRGHQPVRGPRHPTGGSAPTGSTELARRAGRLWATAVAAYLAAGLPARPRFAIDGEPTVEGREALDRLLADLGWDPAEPTQPDDGHRKFRGKKGGLHSPVC
jgi:hypothetical protein